VQSQALEPRGLTFVEDIGWWAGGKDDEAACSGTQETPARGH